MVELRRRLIHDVGPRRAVVGRDRGAAIIAIHHASRILRIDPESVIVAMRSAKRCESLAAVYGAIAGSIEDVNDVRIFGIGEEVCVVPGALTELAIVGGLRPGIATIVRAEQSTLFGFNQGVNAIWIGSGSDCDATERSFGQSVSA